jgi:predicted enzyme related to lactoylglutathione lyase
VSKHAIVHVEFAATDPEKLGAFYHELFDWKVEAWKDYVMFQAEGGPGGGFTTVSDGIKPGDVVAYISTDDIDASLAQAEALGAKTLMGKTEVPSMGWMAMFADPTGNKVGLWTDARQG